MERESAINALPWPVMAIGALIVAVELVLSLAQYGLVGGPTGIGWRVEAIQRFGFSPAVWEQVALRGNFAPDMLWRFLTYLFVHGSAVQALFGGAILLALGKFVGEALGSARLLALIVVTGLAGAVAFGLFVPGQMPLFGLWPVDYGLIGAFTYLTWLRLKMTGGNQLTAFRLIGVLLGLQLVFSLLFGNNPTWVAELGGFVAGFLLAIPLAPGGWSRLIERVRTR
ncbi:rhomboid family intramembrane serine protease [Pseudoroseicyclus tamaricis]|uniref:Rhomboid family intramembrane serine protease n=1 Tax=Pseudoroseicyclus tamaricis TaxID=2705421 RepID=A0A6B2JV95_9RHOB|nr:rhomboid family intramembrane serine protease [Pseudoroseicyclus tamaricis]NDV00104.1 rhomboid family intramembrane serine protease [Pseudoroseicyclus tamaricis]